MCEVPFRVRRIDSFGPSIVVFSIYRSSVWFMFDFRFVTSCLWLKSSISFVHIFPPASYAPPSSPLPCNVQRNRDLVTSSTVCPRWPHGARWSPSPHVSVCPRPWVRWCDDDGTECHRRALTCQLMRLDRFSTTRRYSVRVGGPYL